MFVIWKLQSNAKSLVNNVSKLCLLVFAGIELERYSNVDSSGLVFQLAGHAIRMPLKLLDPDFFNLLFRAYYKQTLIVKISKYKIVCGIGLNCT